MHGSIALILVFGIPLSLMSFFEWRHALFIRRIRAERLFKELNQPSLVVQDREAVPAAFLANAQAPA